MLWDEDIFPKQEPEAGPKPGQKLKDSGRNKSARDFWWSINVSPIRTMHKREHQRAKPQRGNSSGRH
jgi:hypothetical protein